MLCPRKKPPSPKRKTAAASSGIGRKRNPVKEEGAGSPGGTGCAFSMEVKKAMKMSQINEASRALSKDRPRICVQMMSQRALPISSAKVAAPGLVRMRQYCFGSCLMASQRERGGALTYGPAYGALEVGGGIWGPVAGP